jgi:hypothetical protein
MFAQIISLGLTIQPLSFFNGILPELPGLPLVEGSYDHSLCIEHFADPISNKIINGLHINFSYQAFPGPVDHGKFIHPPA